MLDTFEEKILSNINFEGIFDGKVLNNKLENNQLLIYIPKLTISLSNDKEELKGKESINNPNIINNSTTKNSVEVTNGIICKPLIKNQELLIPEIGEHVLVFFFDGNPQNAYYINYNLYNQIHHTRFIKELIENDENFDIHKSIDELSIVYDKFSKCYIVNNAHIQVRICQDSIKLFKHGKEIDLKGEKGDKGEDGKNGKDGKDGRDGIDGKNGKDGRDGKDGEKGEKGEDGKDGVDGKNGEQGERGKDGRDGIDGKNGKDGKDGRDGKDGEKGEKGEDGKTGPPGKPKNWDSLEGKPSGSPGQAYFISEDSSTDIRLDYTLHEGIFVENDQELTDAKGKKLSFEEVFNTWERFSHHTNTEDQPALPNETQSWKYESSTDQVICTINSNSHIGFISRDRFDSFTHEATVKSTADDDDMIGLVIAYVRDINGREHTLTALRVRNTNQTHVRGEPGGKTLQWALIYNFGRTDAKVIQNKTVKGDNIGNWSNIPNGTRIRTIRNGDMIEAYTSTFNTTNILPETKLSVDLSSDPDLQRFRVKASYGFSCKSQNASTFTDLLFTGNTRPIYDIRNHEVWEFINEKWGLSKELNLYKDFGVGKFLLNLDTQKLFYIRGIDLVDKITSKENEVVSSYSRPTVNNYVGRQVFDETLGRPLWYNGKDWVDSSGKKV